LLWGSNQQGHAIGMGANVYEEMMFIPGNRSIIQLFLGALNGYLIVWNKRECSFQNYLFE
jgi:hypothetical protein